MKEKLHRKNYLVVTALDCILLDNVIAHTYMPSQE